MKTEEGISKSRNNTAKRWKRILLVLLSLILAVVFLSFLAVWLLEDKIKAMIVSEINEQVTVPVKVDGSIGLSFIKHFPYASITFEKVSIDDVLSKGSKKLLRVEELSFLCNLYSLIGDKMEFSKVVVRDGVLNMYKDESGKVNYDILKSKKQGQENKVSVQLQMVQIKAVTFTYLDKTQGTDVDLKLKDISLKGNFKEENFDLDTKGNIRVNRIAANREELFSQRNISVEIVLEVDNIKKNYNFKKGKIGVEEMEFSITGFLASVRSGVHLDFKFLTDGKDMQQLFALVPQRYKDGFANAGGTGSYSISAVVKGIIGKSSLPKVNVNLDLKESELKFDNYNKLLKNVNATARYESDENGNDKIVISNFNCTLNDLPFSFRLSLIKLSDPDFDFYANGVLHLSELSSLVPDTLIQDIEGTISFNNFHLKGRKSDFSDVENSTLTGSGEFKFHEVEFRQNGITYGNINGLLKYENKIIEVRNFSLNFLSTDFNFSGTIENLFPFVYNLSAKRRSNEVVLNINGELKTEVFNLTGILNAYDRKNRPIEQRKEKLNIREVLSMRGNLDVEIKKFLFRKMEYTDLKTNLQVSPGLIRVNHLEANAMGGALRTTGLIGFTAENSLNLKIDVSAVELDVSQIFNECENFGQTTLTEKHMKGTITTSVSLDATWKNYKELDERTLYAVVDFRVNNGELINFEPLKAASKFIRIEELKNIRFASLGNTIKIANARIDIPEFEIKTSALNLMFFGHHSFDNIVDYHFKINLHKVLAQKFNRSRKDIDYIEEGPYEGVNLYLLMTGNLSNPTIKFDKSSTRKKIQADFRNEKEVWKDLLKNTPNKTDQSEKKREGKYFNVNEQPQFIDFDTTNE